MTRIDYEAFADCSSLSNVVFLGSAPAMSQDCFGEYWEAPEPTIYHSCTDATWTDEVKGNLPGKLTRKEHLFACTPNGISKCIDCGITDTEYVPAFPHSFGSDGLCTVCGQGPDIIINMTGEWTGSWNDNSIEVYADGTLITTATVPSGKYTNQVKVPHIPGTTYTFKWAGYANYDVSFTISMDGEVWASGNGVDYSDGQAIYTMENTCIHQYKTVTVQPTCTTDGSKTTLCALCGKKTVVTLPVTGHNNTTARVEATCTTDGYQTTTCSVCGETETVVFKAPGHNYEAEVTAPTCTQDGVSILTCQGCGSSYNAIIPATGHQVENGTCILCGQGAGITLSGTVTSFATGAVTLTLTGNGIEKTVTTDTGSYRLDAAPGQYILTVSKANHVTRQYAVTLESGNVTLDVKILQIGDIDGNGKVNIGDVAKLIAHLKGTGKLTDEYQILCANVNGGSLNMGDSAALYSHIRGTKKLY